MTLGEKINSLRVKSGISQDTLAEVLGVSRQAVSKWERDEALPDIENIIKLSDYFSVSCDWLLKDTQPEPEKKEEPQEIYGVDKVFDSIGTFVKTKWYYAGYVCMAYGIYLAVTSLPTLFFLLDSGALIGNTFGNAAIISGDMGLPFSLMNMFSHMPWLMVAIVVVQIAFWTVGGFFILKYGKRYCKRYEVNE